jgi:AraC-like DNA-binding protein
LWHAADFLYLDFVLHDLKIGSIYDGFLFLAETSPDAPWLQSHHHVELELNLVIRGSITYVMGNQRYTFPAGTLLWFFPEQEHQLVDRSSTAQHYVAVFKPAFIRRVCRTPAYAMLNATRTESEGIQHAMLSRQYFHSVRNAMDCIMEGSLDRDVLNREAGFGVDSDFCYQHADPDGLNAGLHFLLTLCWRLQNSHPSGESAIELHPSVQRAIRLLSEGEWTASLSALATRCKISDAHLSRLFHQQIGVSLTHYRSSLRMARFWEELKRSPDANLTEAAYAAGFGSYSQFYSLFVEAYGKGPREMLSSHPSMAASGVQPVFARSRKR